MATDFYRALPTVKTAAELAALSDEFVASENAKDIGDRTIHYVITNGGELMTESPAYDDGEVVHAATRRMVRAGVPGMDLGREYHFVYCNDMTLGRVMVIALCNL